MIDGPTYRLSENLARQCLPNWHLAQVHRVDFDNDYFAKNPLSNRELAPIFDTFHEHRFDFYMREWGGLGADDLEAVVDALCDSVLLQRRVWPDRQPRLPVSSVMAAFSAYKKLLGWAPEVKTVLEVGPGTGLISLFMKRLPALERYSQVEACQGLYLLQGMANDMAFPYEVEEKALPQNLATAADFHLVENPLLELPCYVDMPRRPPRCVHYPWWRVGELMKQPGSVDVVMSNANLREFSQYALRDYLALFRRVLKPDGVVLAQCLGGELHRDASGLISELRDMKFAPIVFDLQGGSRWFSGPNLPLMAKSFCTSNAVLVGPEHPLFEKYNKAECFEGCHFGAEPAVLDMYFPQDGLRRLYSVAELRDLVEARLVVRLTSADPVGVRSTKRRPRATDDQPLFTSSFDPRSVGAPDSLAPRVSALVDEWRAKSARVVIFGAGEHTRLLDRCTVMKRANIVGVVDSSPSRQGCEIMGSKIQAPSAIPALRPDVVVISSAAYQEEIYRSLAGLEAQGISIVRLYENSKQPS